MSLYKGLRGDCLHNELETAVFTKGRDETDYAAGCDAAWLWLHRWS